MEVPMKPYSPQVEVLMIYSLLLAYILILEQKNIT